MSQFILPQTNEINRMMKHKQDVYIQKQIVDVAIMDKISSITCTLKATVV